MDCELVALHVGKSERRLACGPAVVRVEVEVCFVSRDALVMP